MRRYMRFRSLVDSSNARASRPGFAAGRRIVSCGIVLWSAVACSAGGNDNPGLLPAQPDTSAGGSGPSIGGSTSDPTTAPGAGEAPGFDLGDDVGDGVAAPGCQQAERKFDPTIPTVFMLGCALDVAGLPYDLVNLGELGFGDGRPS